LIVKSTVSIKIHLIENVAKYKINRILPSDDWDCEIFHSWEITSRGRQLGSDDSKQVVIATRLGDTAEDRASFRHIFIPPRAMHRRWRRREGIVAYRLEIAAKSLPGVQRACSRTRGKFRV